MPLATAAPRPHYVLAIDEFGCAYEWAEFWAVDRFEVQDFLAGHMNVWPVLLRVVAI